MPVKIIYKNKRHGTDRREGTHAYQGTDRRSGMDRRKLDEKLKHMLKSNMKDQEKEKQRPIQQGSGKVVRRKKKQNGLRTEQTDKI